MVVFKPGVKEVRDIEEDEFVSDDDFDLSEFIPQENFQITKNNLVKANLKVH